MLEALAHRPTDRAPANYHAHADVTERLLASQGLADVGELRQRLGVDFRRIGINYQQPDTGPDADGYMRSMWGLRVHPDLPAGDPRRVIAPFHEGSTVEEVRAQVRSYLNLTAERGGCVLVGSREFIADIPDENILAMYDENLRAGR